MNIPKTVKIGYKNYLVKEVEHLDDDERLLYGQILYNDEVISLSKKYPENQMKCTLVHEIIHGIDDLMGVGLQEDLVEKLAKGLYQVIQDNPDMFKNS